MNKKQQLTYELKNYLGNALLQLMKKEPFEKIRVDDIVEKAQVSRATYYRQFKSKEDLLAFYLAQKWPRYVQNKKLDWNSLSPEQSSLVFFNFMYEMREVNELVIRQGLKYLILQAMILMFPEIMTASKQISLYQDHFRAYGLFGLSLCWIENDYDLEIDVIAKLATKYFYLIK